MNRTRAVLGVATLLVLTALVGVGLYGSDAVTVSDLTAEIRVLEEHVDREASVFSEVASDLFVATRERDEALEMVSIAHGKNDELLALHEDLRERHEELRLQKDPDAIQALMSNVVRAHEDLRVALEKANRTISELRAASDD